MFSGYPSEAFSFLKGSRKGVDLVERGWDKGDWEDQREGKLWSLCTLWKRQQTNKNGCLSTSFSPKIPSGTDLWHRLQCYFSPCKFMCVNTTDLEWLFLWCPPFPRTLRLFLPWLSLQQCSLCPDERGLIDISHLDLSVLRCHILCNVCCGSLYFFP